MKTLELFWMNPHSWAVIFEGVVSQATVVKGKQVPDELRASVCCCGCGEDACREGHLQTILNEMRDSETWVFAEGGVQPYLFRHEFERGRVTVVRISYIESEGRRIQ